ncbi:MAG: hypothetical protein AAF675_07395 [Pseudomonadota bacterium]
MSKDGRPGEKDTRDARLSAALRANLARRKAQGRARAATQATDAAAATTQPGDPAREGAKTATPSDENAG